MNNEEYYSLLSEKGLTLNGFRPDSYYQPENYLYRYRGNYEHILEEIKSSLIYTSPLEKLNDPFDSTYKMTIPELLEFKATLGYFEYTFRDLLYFDKRVELYGKLGYENDFITFKDFVNRLSSVLHDYNINRTPEYLAEKYFKYYYKDSPRRTNVRIASFSEKCDSIPMWAYYADNHKGVCIRYNFQKLEQTEKNNNILKSIHKVWYTDNKPVDKEGKYSHLIKSQSWVHEQEWRLVNFDSSIEKVDLPCIDGLYLGINFPMAKIDELTELAHEKNIEVFLCQPNPIEYKIDFLRLTPTKELSPELDI